MLVYKKSYFENPLEGVQNTLLTYLAPDISYPAESVRVWNFVQIFVAGVTTKFDIGRAGLNTLYNSLVKNRC